MKFHVDPYCQNPSHVLTMPNFLGVVHDDLKNFLETMLPKKAGKLGVSDSRIAGSITEDLDIECDFGGVVAEILRGIR